MEADERIDALCDLIDTLVRALPYGLLTIEEARAMVREAGRVLVIGTITSKLGDKLVA